MLESKICSKIQGSVNLLNFQLLACDRCGKNSYTNPFVAHCELDNINSAHN